jgi:hypothetical protein
MAYSLAQQEAGRNNEQRNQSAAAPLPPPLPQPQRPLPPIPHHPAMPVTSQFGEAVSLPPPAAGTRPDLAMAAALAESQFSARQADELARTTEAVYQAAVNKALEASLQTANYDDLLRDIKLWVIDLAASTDDVLTALDSIVRQRREVAVRLEKALDASEGDYDERKIRKLSWMAEQLPSIEEKLRNLADKMMPIGVAVVELQDLRDHIGARSPPLDEAGHERDLIIIRLFKAMEEAGLRPPSRSDGGEIEVDENGAGPSTSKQGRRSNTSSPSGVQAPADLRDLVAALIDEAQKLPKMPRRKRSTGSVATSATTATTSLADLSEVRELPVTPSGGSVRDGDRGGEREGEGTPQSTLVTAAAASAAVSALSLENGPKEEEQKEERTAQPSAPEPEPEQPLLVSEAPPMQQQQQEELSLDVLPTPAGNDLVSIAEKEEIAIAEPVLTAPEGLLQPHRIENFEEEEENEEEEEAVPNEQQIPLAAAEAASPSALVPTSDEKQQQEEEHLTSVTPSMTDKDTTTTTTDTNEKEQEKKKTVKKAPLWRRLSGTKNNTQSPSSPSIPVASPSSSISSATSTTPSSSQRRTSSPGTFTTPVPFQLSSSRWKAKGPSEAPTAADTLRRVPALISLHYEMEKDFGVVADAVGWTKKVDKIELGPTVTVAPPAAVSISSISFDSPEEMVLFVKKQPEGSFPSTVPSRFDASSRWSVMCAAAGAHEALTSAIQELSSWEVKGSVVAESHRLVEYLARVSAILATVANAHDPLRHAVVKHRLPWEESLTIQVRWAAQHAGIAVMSQAIEASEEAERTKGAWQRQAVLQPLGHGVMAAFSVHQLAGGFGTEAASVCDYLVERTVHYARMIDPKWFRGHKVVA